MPVTDRLSGRCQAKRAASGAADKVRSGAQPGDGKVLGLNEPPSLIAIANEVINLECPLLGAKRTLGTPLKHKRSTQRARQRLKAH